MKAKVTPWFGGDVRPARKGVYERNDSKTALANGKPAFSRWTGNAWGDLCMTKEIAAKTTGTSAFQKLPWRGLASDPSKASA